MLLFFISATSWSFGRQIKYSENPVTRKMIVTFAVFIDLLVLGFFKYYGFFTSSFNNLLLKLGMSTNVPLFEILLPVGISFFTFQAISYVIDVYRNDIEACENLSDVLLYVSFFPQLVAGPIVRASDFIPQLAKKPTLTGIMVSRGFLLIIAGLFKKMFFANYLSSLIVDPVFDDPSSYSGIDNLFAVYGYAFQIYFDFSAYSDIAIGVALLLGYEFRDNFNQPYRAFSIQDFWRRWHISLSTWLRDYLYLPMGGSRTTKLKTYRNLAITMLLGGLWHGAAWNFVLWGGLHGFALLSERAVYKRFGIKISNPVLKILLTIFVFHFVCLTWIFFRAANFSTAIAMISQIFQGGINTQYITPFLIFLLTCGVIFTYFPQKKVEKAEVMFSRLNPILLGLFLGTLLVFLGALAPEGVSPFIYFQF